MGDAEKRQNICKLCILVKGFSNETNFNNIKQQFPKSVRAELVRRSANFEPREKEWIVQCHSVNDVQEYINWKVLKSTYGILNISPCELPCDVPEEWLQAFFDSANVPMQAKPPAYSDIYHGGDHGSAQHPPLGHHHQYDPRLMQQAGQYPYHGMPWAAYQQDSAGQNISSPEKGPPPSAYWPPQQGYYPYGSYPGYPSFGQAGVPHPGLPPAPQHRQDGAGNTSQPVVDRPVDVPSDEASNQLADDVTMDSFSNNDNPESDVEDQVVEPKKSTTNMLKVTKLPPGTTEDTLENFFENTRKFGGGDVEQVDYDDKTNSAIITFVEEGAVEKVLQKKPILFNKKIIEVEAYVVNVEPPIEVSREEFYDCEGSPQETEVSCTIEVRGMKPSTSEDTILYYFESKKGAQADVKEREFVEDKNMYLLTFEDDAAVDRALSKSHVVDGAQLRVKKHVPPKRYPNKALVKGLSENTSIDILTNYLEARTRKDIVSVDFSDADSQKAIVTFTESIDINEIQTTCKKKALDGSFLTIHPVFVTNCIIVRGYSDKTTENALEFYFDNKIKSGVNGVTDIQMNTDEDYCVIYFEDPKGATSLSLLDIICPAISCHQFITLRYYKRGPVKKKYAPEDTQQRFYALAACQKSHVIDNCKLQVQVFYDCLGIPAGDEGPKFKSLSPIIIVTLDKRKVKFLLASKPNREALEKQLEYAIITWPTGDSNQLKIECTLTKETKDCRTLAKSWEDNTRKKISTFLDMVVVEEHSTLQEAWQSVMEKLRNINISNPDSVNVTVNKTNCKIYIVGHKIQVKEISDKVKVIIDEVINDTDKRKQQMQEEINLKHHQLMILVLTHFPYKIKQKFQNIEVKIDTKKLAVTFDGISGEITAAKISMYETLNTIVSASIGDRSPSFIQFLKDPEVGSYIGQKMKAKNVVGIWDIQDNNITMYAMSDAEAVDAADIFKRAIIETQVSVDNLQQSALCSPKWTQFIKDIEEECQRKSVFTKIVVDNPGEIILLCTATGEADIIREKMQDFILQNTERENAVVSDVIMPGIFDPVELKSLLKQGGTYKSYRNRIYLAGACSVGKSTLASLLIGEEIPLEWKSTDGLKIFFGRNGIHLEERKMVPLGKDNENQNILSNVLRGQPKLDKYKPDMVKIQPVVDKRQQKMMKGQSEDGFTMSTSGNPLQQQAINVSSGTGSEQSGPIAAGKVHFMSNVPENQNLIDESINMQYNDKSMQKKRLGYNLMQEGIKQELKKGKYKVKIAPSDLVDFGGQKSYDMTHQLFIQGKGTFTLIFDGRKGLRDPLNEYPQGDVTTESILKHWVDSILTYCGEEDDDILPIILFVATHRDRLPEDKQSKIMTEFKQGLKEMFHNHERKNRIKYDDIFFINGRDGSDPEVLRLQTSYVNIAFKQKSWGRPMPLVWVPLELQIMEMRSNNINIISKDDLVKINTENDDLELTSKQLNDFLRSQHLFGNIMYFESEGLEKFIILQPTFLVDILRSFITDQMFFPSDATLRQILNEMIMTGKIRKQDLFKLWNQDQFNQHMPDDKFKQYVTKVLVHLDFLVEPKYYNTRKSTSDFYLVPCAVNRKPATDFIKQLDNNKTICLSYKLLKSSIPSALSFKLIGAAINIWPLKETEKGVVCLYHKAAVLCIDNINMMYLSVQNDRIMVYLTNETSNYFIPPEIASCVQECLTLTLTTSLEFYHSSFGKVVPKVTIAKLFEIEVVQKCGTEICYISLTDISMKKPPWKCSLGREHTTEFPMYWTYKKECGMDCKGLDEHCLILCPEYKHLARLARHIGMSTFDLFVITLGLSRVVWEEFEYKYHGRDPLMLKHDILCRWKISTDKPRSFEDLRTALKKNGYDQHILCQIFREDRAILDLKDNILQEVPDNDTLLELSGQLINCAIHLGVELGIDFCNIAETMEKYNKEMSKQNYDILMKWKNSRSSQNKTIRYLMHIIKIVFPGACTFLQKKYHIAS